LQFIHAYSGQEAKDLLSQHDDVAMVLLDVVMEDSEAGLSVAKYIRNDLNNHYSRVIIRTGQPGLAPEEQIIEEYDIDGYNSKTQISVQSLQLMFYTNLRAYRDLVGVQKRNKGLESVANAMTTLTSAEQIPDFATRIMEELNNVLNVCGREFIS
jgi:CheY-like chemotaxis protein